MIENVTFQGAVGALSPGQAEAIARIAKEAGAVWQRALQTSATGLQVVIEITTEYPRASASSVTSRFLGKVDGVDRFMAGAAYEMLTGNDVNGSSPDVLVRLHPDYLKEVWINPLDGSAAPAGKRDLLSTLTHELGHALGFDGWTDWTTYTKPSYQSAFDALLKVIDGRPFFVGEHAVAAFGGPVPLTPGGVFHVGNPTFGPDLTNDLMNGIKATPGTAIAPSALDIAFMSDLGLPTPLNDRLQGVEQDDRMAGGPGDDTITGGGGNDILHGGPGYDVAVYSGAAAHFLVTRLADGGWSVKDQRTAGGEGSDSLYGVESIRFADQVKVLETSIPSYLEPLFANLLRIHAGSADAANLAAAAVAANVSPQGGLEFVIDLADMTTTVATLSYQFFTGSIPGAGGYDFLVSPNGPNPNNLSGPYFAGFNFENRYINFAINLGRDGAGKDAFAAGYGDLSLQEATAKAYGEIFGVAADTAKVEALLGGPSLARADYFDAYSGDGRSGIGTKAAMVGWLLSVAAKEDLGPYAEASNAFLTDLADGSAQFGVNLVGVYGDPL